MAANKMEECAKLAVCHVSLNVKRKDRGFYASLEDSHPIHRGICSHLQYKIEIEYNNYNLNLLLIYELMNGST